MSSEVAKHEAGIELRAGDGISGAAAAAELELEVRRVDGMRGWQAPVRAVGPSAREVGDSYSCRHGTGEDSRVAAITL